MTRLRKTGLLKWRVAAGLGAAALLTAAFPAAARDAGGKVGVVSHVKVLSNHADDVSSVEAWKESFITDGMTDQEKAIAIFNSMVKYRQQANPPQEGLQFEGCVHDPIKTMNVYGYGQCCCASGSVEGLARYLGMEARGRILHAHSVPEVSFDDGRTWHLIDASVMNYFVKDDGTLASVDDIRGQVRGWLEQHPDLRGKDSALRKFARDGGWKNGPVLLAGADAFYGKDGVNTAGWHGWPSTMQEYDWSDSKASVYEYGVSMGYQVNVQLRPGERVTRNWFATSIDGTNRMSESYFKDLQTRKHLGIQTRLGDEAPGRIGSGSRIWDLPLSSEAIGRSALVCDNLAVRGGRLMVADAARAGVLIVRVPSSYVYIDGNLSFTPILPPGAAVSVAISDNNGLDWSPLAVSEGAGAQTINLKEHIFRRYDYRLKFEMTGQGAGLAAARVENVFQCSQAALPTLKEGDNTITFTAGPQEGTVTVEGAMNPNVAEKAGQLSHLDFKPVLDGLSENSLRAGASGTGSATYRLVTPGDITRVRISSTYRARDPRDKYDVSVSFDGGEHFRIVQTLDDGNPGSSRYFTVEDVPPHTREALVRLEASQKNTVLIFNLRMDADYVEPAGGFVPVKITYGWEENGREKTDVHIARSPRDRYTIRCGPGTVVKRYAVELAD